MDPYNSFAHSIETWGRRRRYPSILLLLLLHHHLRRWWASIPTKALWRGRRSLDDSSVAVRARREPHRRRWRHPRHPKPLLSHLIHRRRRGDLTSHESRGRESVVLARLGSEESLGGRTVSFSLPVLLECVTDCHGFVHEELRVHRLDSRVRRFEGVVGDESVALGGSTDWISRNLGNLGSAR
jgi:hypothetical protein